MLRDGKFIKENPPKIGSHYVPQIEREYSEEEQLMQEVNLGYKPKSDYKGNSVIYWLIFIYCVIAIAAAVFR